jgi:3-aminobutyryl-CoA ammonia-lyase
MAYLGVKALSETKELTATIRVRLSAHDAHYGGNLVNGAYMLSLFGDVATELAILCDGDEGLLVGYEKVELLAPLFAGDYVEAFGRITKVGRTSRRMEFECRKVIVARPDISDSAADVLEEPILVGRATGTTVVKAERQRKTKTA